MCPLGAICGDLLSRDDREVLDLAHTNGPDVSSDGLEELTVWCIPDDDEQPPKPRDDDTHYFESYAENDIHAVMINDKVRTATYAKFILSNPEVFRDAVVLDVGCGTGILSLFAAKAGAKRVFAIDASDIAEKAESIVKVNELDNVIT